MNKLVLLLVVAIAFCVSAHGQLKIDSAKKEFNPDACCKTLDTVLQKSETEFKKNTLRYGHPMSTFKSDSTLHIVPAIYHVGCISPRRYTGAKIAGGIVLAAIAYEIVNIYSHKRF